MKPVKWINVHLIWHQESLQSEGFSITMVLLQHLECAILIGEEVHLVVNSCNISLIYIHVKWPLYMWIWGPLRPGEKTKYHNFVVYWYFSSYNASLQSFNCKKFISRFQFCPFFPAAEPQFYKLLDWKRVRVHFVTFRRTIFCKISAGLMIKSSYSSGHPFKHFHRSQISIPLFL